MNNTESKMMNRYEGAMLGVAVGDALGAPLEFMDAQEIQRRYRYAVREMIGGGWLNVMPGEVTDDTQMTLAVAEGIAQHKQGAQRHIGENFLKWYRTHPKDVGGTCAVVIEEMNRSKRPPSVSDWKAAAQTLYYRTDGRTAGNGALMRTVYPALWYKDTDAAITAAVEIGQMTHWHSLSDATLTTYTRAINEIVNSAESIDEAKNRLKKIAIADDPRPTGFCVDSLNCAIQSILRTDCFEDAIVDAVNRGGDADTIGAITGGLAGAIYGADAIPLRWTYALNNEPNRRTVQLFFNSNEPDETTLVNRLLDLADMAYHNQK